ncbi:MAG: AraC family ligand binding domain-containing protein [Clostridium sp.]|nr:AraC family ligand binding domain-containing protein [Clostridium sp.]
MREYSIEKGSIVLFNPGDNHACVQSDDGTFDYRGFNIAKEVMLDLAEEVSGKWQLPGFSFRNIVEGGVQRMNESAVLRWIFWVIYRNVRKLVGRRVWIAFSVLLSVPIIT